MLTLKGPLGKEDEQYVQIANLQKFLLGIAVAQINEHNDLQANC
jgi:hypothetical protein